MAVYKVPQDVEADDKLIGPFSFRQFIYLIVVAIAMAVAWFLGQLFIGLIVVPLPFILFFGALALPLRKDQPMETYLLAMAHYYLKPKKRLWDPDGNLSKVLITAVSTKQERLTKDYGSEEADRRLSYLAQVIDTGGWASRGVIAPPSNMSDTYYNEAMRTEDIMDESTGVAQSFDALISRSDTTHKQAVASQFQQAMAQPPSAAAGQSFQAGLDDDSARQIIQQAENIHLEANPYPSSMNQTVIQPLDQRHVVPVNRPEPMAATAPVSPSASIPEPQYPPSVQAVPTEAAKKPATAAVSSDIMKLANNSSHLSVEALAHEAHRLENKDSEEVVINLR